MFKRVKLNEERARANTSIWIIWREIQTNKNSTPVVFVIWITASDSSLAEINYPLATWFQLFSRDFRLSLAKPPEKPLVKTRPLCWCTFWLSFDSTMVSPRSARAIVSPTAFNYTLCQKSNFLYCHAHAWKVSESPFRSRTLGPSWYCFGCHWDTKDSRELVLLTYCLKLWLPAVHTLSNSGGANSKWKKNKTKCCGSCELCLFLALLVCEMALCSLFEPFFL